MILNPIPRKRILKCQNDRMAFQRNRFCLFQPDGALGTDLLKRTENTRPRPPNDLQRDGIGKTMVLRSDRDRDAFRFLSSALGSTAKRSQISGLKDIGAKIFY